MKTSRRANQQGIAHLVLIVLLFVVVAGIGFVGWKVVSKKSNSTAADAVTKAAVAATCAETDKKICTFMSNWKTQPYYTIQMTSTTDGNTTTSTTQVEGTKKFHMTASSPAYDVIVINDDTYTKAPNGVWWKQTHKPEEIKQMSASADPSQKVAEDDSTNDSKSTTTYRFVGTEACGNLTCYKYQVVDSSSPGDESLIWFDTKDYLLRKSHDHAEDGSVTESVFSYDKVTISVPSPVKELGPNQALMPGQNEPTTLPDGSAAQNSLESFPRVSSAADGGSTSE